MANGDLNPKFVMQVQEQTLWCWAAVACSIGDWFLAQQHWLQCELVNTELGENTCCQNGSDPLTCNKTYSLHQALQTTGNLLYYLDTPVAFSSVQAQINQNEPVGARILWDNGGGAHFVVISGWYSGWNPDGVTVCDSLEGTSTYMEFSVFESSYEGHGTWTHTYYTQGVPLEGE